MKLNFNPLREIIKSFFYSSDGKFQPIYYYAFIFSHLIIIMVICRLLFPLGGNDKLQLSDVLILGMMVYVPGLILLYNFTKPKNGNGE